MVSPRARRGADESPGEPRLKIALPEAQKAIEERISAGRELVVDPRNISSDQELDKSRDRFYTWEEYNFTWLEMNVGKPVAQEYRGSPFAVGPLNLQQEIASFNSDVESSVRRLESILGRLPLWEDLPIVVQSSREPDANAPIFIVHGHQDGLAQQVARILERSTGRDAIILHEQANQGRTVLEKFESHAEEAAFAVVLLTGDDEGRKVGDPDLRPRGRQNVIFELGFFFGKLGRNRVMVLVNEGIEHPSDVAGLVYEVVDSNGAWKQALARELMAAGIDVNHSRIP